RSSDLLADGEWMLVGPLHLEAGTVGVRLVAIRVGLRRASAARAPVAGSTVAAASPGALPAILELLLGQHDPFAQRRRHFLDEARHDAVARRAVQHAAAGIREIEALPRAR